MQPAAADPFQPREMWPSGTVIKGDYTIDSRLGAGGFGTVYKAHHRVFGSTHVIKRLHEQFASDREFVNKFVSEARSIHRLKGHPNVVDVQNMTQTDDGHLIIVMEHLPGGDLASLLGERQLTVEKVIDFSRQIAAGLLAAHGAGLVPFPNLAFGARRKLQSKDKIKKNQGTSFSPPHRKPTSLIRPEGRTQPRNEERTT